MRYTSCLYLVLSVAALGPSLLPVSSRAAAGDLFVAELTIGGHIYRFTPAGDKSIFASDLQAPVALAFDREGNLFVVEGDSILKFGPDGTQSTFAAGLSSPGALAFDGAGNLYVTESFGDIGDILKFTPAGAKSTFVSGATFLELAFDTSGNLFAASGGPTDVSGTIIRFLPDGTGSTFALSAGPGMAVNSAGFLFAKDNSGFSTIARFSPDGGRTPFTSEVDHPARMAFDAGGNLFVADPAEGKVFKITPDASVSTFASNLDQPTSLAFEPVTEKLRNISARGLVGTGDDVLIGGFIAGGNALANNAVVVRAIGPSLAQAGVSNSLADPTLELHNSSGALIASNDDWQDTQEEQIAASGLAPAEPNESAIHATLPAGNYTAVVRGAGDSTGTALVEVYSLNQ